MTQEEKKIHRVIAQFADAIREKMLDRLEEGWTGWDSKDLWTEEEEELGVDSESAIAVAIVDRIDKQLKREEIDPVDIASYAMFLFYFQIENFS